LARIICRGKALPCPSFLFYFAAQHAKSVTMRRHPILSVEIIAALSRVLHARGKTARGKPRANAIGFFRTCFPGAARCFATLCPGLVY
jgi:hypothetical protein